ncbi:hypothetical protein BAE44_0016490 [Dichanthelium oligosanthes]|uniref:Transcription repressor n=1 Tax=Dichanthelium oligosanthes TaxID=888268 RepID=A0A1E5VBT9_9POAL|nr:hypothetical protein BAE44_0016490 [Dichanthelium oligosanthes]
MDHGGGAGGRSSSRLRARLARMFRPASLLRSTCNTTASTCSSSSSSTTAPGAGAAASSSKAPPPPPASACSSSHALLSADAAVARDSSRYSFLASSRRDLAALLGRTESFSTAIERLHRHAGGVAPAPPSRFSVDAPPLIMEASKDKEKSPREYYGGGDSGVKSNSDKMKMKLLSNPYGFSSSDDDGDTEVFSSDAEDLTGRGGSSSKKLSESAETFFSSSRSFSSDSSEFYTNKKKKKKNKSPAVASSKPPPKPPKRGQIVASRRHRRAASGACDTCGVRDGFRPVVCAAEEQVRKGFAVVKRSRDPYADFRSSMVEMIVGRQLFGATDMERLLRSYLSLNAPRHHAVILQAFSDIWVVVHGG